MSDDVKKNITVCTRLNAREQVFMQHLCEYYGMKQSEMVRYLIRDSYNQMNRGLGKYG